MQDTNEVKYPEIEAVLVASRRPWHVAGPVGRALAHFVIQNRPARLLEFGAGLSSLVLARALARSGGGTLTSVEQMPEWLNGIWQLVESTLAVDAQLIKGNMVTRFQRGALVSRYDVPAAVLSARGPFDFVFIDAPQPWYSGDAALHAGLAHLAVNATVAFHDRDKHELQHRVTQALRMCSALQRDGSAATAVPNLIVLRLNGDHRQAASPLSIRSDTFAFLRTLSKRVRFEAWLRKRRAQALPHALHHGLLS